MGLQNSPHDVTASSESHRNAQSRLSRPQAEITRSTDATVVLEAAAHLHQLITVAIPATIARAEKFHRLSLNNKIGV